MRAPDGRADVRRMIDLAVRAERQGFDSVWIGDSILARPRFEALTTLAAISQRTERVTLGTAVYLSALRHPVPLAHSVGNLDLLTGSRLLFGIGLGPPNAAVRAEYAACGVEHRRRGAIQEEGLQVMEGLWTGKPFTFRGKFFQLDNITLHPLPGRPGGPPVLLAAAADRPLRRIARFADGWLPISPSAEAFSNDWEKLRGFCAEVGRNPGSLLGVLYVTLNINSDRAQAQREMDAFLDAYHGKENAAAVSRTQGHEAGEPERCADFLRKFAQAGARHFVVRFAATDQESQMDRLLTEVVPLLSDA
jgi:alkanesulfonate monooxygenase SsuD/methylene tetrahydromethanopterin reductase-like flavin-dependent oxidoreductase (luciferase family)